MMVLDTPDHHLADGLLEVVEEVVMARLLFLQEKVSVDLDMLKVVLDHMRVQVMVQRSLL
tara:strand:- start:148 stop:327 length:180 start_codon:yes stop_codon:yes gene_type:complete